MGVPVTQQHTDRECLQVLFADETVYPLALAPRLQLVEPRVLRQMLYILVVGPGG